MVMVNGKLAMVMGTVGLARIRDGPRNPQSLSLLLLSLLTTLLEIHEN